MDRVDLTPMEPPITDGYLRITRHDVAFLDLAAHDLAAWQGQLAPLGLAATIASFIGELFKALDSDGVDDADIRVKGSSVLFWSHKPMPVDPYAWTQVFAADHLDDPTDDELWEIKLRWDGWLAAREPPHQRPFDSLYRLGVARDPSDIDLQLSSDSAVAKSAEVHASDADGEELFHPMYDFVRETYSSRALPHTFLFCSDQDARLGRPISLKVFTSGGPPDKTYLGHVSSHFQRDDWILDRES